MNYRDADFYEKNKCDVIYGKQAVKWISTTIHFTRKRKNVT